MKDVQKERRLNWCRAHENYNWDNVFFSDESSVWLFPNSVKIWTKDTVKPIYQRPKHSPKFHMWGAISTRGATPLCIFTGNLTKERYVDILNGHLLPTAQTLYENNWIFQHDNDPKHTARYTKQWLSDENVQVLDWPSYSPDLNPIENVWGVMKDRINQKGLRNIEDMKREVVEYWDTLSHDFLQTLIGSVPRRIQSCIAEQGSLTKY